MPEGDMFTGHRRAWLAVFALLALVMLVAGHAYYRSEAERFRQEKYQDIAAVGELKADQIRQWRRERLA
ncbi:MAG: hypothetical protein RKO24_16785, partial [Candidatus Competibacter sp.]|nr:hypothetical protein [Candidatus Competibacter sp.]